MNWFQIKISLSYFSLSVWCLLAHSASCLPVQPGSTLRPPQSFHQEWSRCGEEFLNWKTYLQSCVVGRDSDEIISAKSLLMMVVNISLDSHRRRCAITATELYITCKPGRLHSHFYWKWTETDIFLSSCRIYSFLLDKLERWVISGGQHYLIFQTFAHFYPLSFLSLSHTHTHKNGCKSHKGMSGPRNNTLIIAAIVLIIIVAESAVVIIIRSAVRRGFSEMQLEPRSE